MNKISRRVLLLFSVLSFLGVCISYFYLPGQIPIHWNSNWEIDQRADKVYIFLIGLLPILLFVVFEFLPKFDPRRENYKKHAKAYDRLEIIFVLLMIIITWITIASSLQIDSKIQLILPGATGITFIIIGNYLPTLKSNYFIGIKNPWTLSSDIVWRKTHKVGGYVFAISGVLMLSMVFIQNSIWNGITFTVMIVGLIGVYFYSYFLYRKINK